MIRFRRVLRHGCYRLRAVLGVAARRVRIRRRSSAGSRLEDPTRDDRESVDVIGEVDYEYELDSSTIVRERVGDPAPIRTRRCRRSRTSRSSSSSTRSRRASQFGVFHDTFVDVALPIVITQARELSLVERRRPQRQHRRVQDGILPTDGFDARDPGTPTTGDSCSAAPTATASTRSTSASASRR